MEITRWDFLQLSGLTTGSFLLPSSLAAFSKKIKAFLLYNPMSDD